MIDVDVVIAGRPLSKLRHDGKNYVVAQKGQKWILRIRNTSWKKILVVPTVDGLSVMDGKEGSYQSSGYILTGRGSIDIPGFRLNDNEVAHFVFNGKEGSYAAKMDKPLNVGVIGVAAFEEVMPPLPPPVIIKEVHHYPPYRPQWPYYPTEPHWLHQTEIQCKSLARGSCCSSDSGLPSVNSVFYSGEVKTAGQVDLPQQNVGTEFGERESHVVSRSAFERQAAPSATVDIFYDDYEGLAAKGVFVIHTQTPQAFPGGGCAPPAGWKG